MPSRLHARERGSAARRGCSPGREMNGGRRSRRDCLLAVLRCPAGHACAIGFRSAHIWRDTARSTSKAFHCIRLSCGNAARFSAATKHPETHKRCATTRSKSPFNPAFGPHWRPYVASPSVSRHGPDRPPARTAAELCRAGAKIRAAVTMLPRMRRREGGPERCVCFCRRFGYR